jgi:gluconate 2-dehydrogenase gamma chain
MASRPSRREILLASAAAVLAEPQLAQAALVKGGLPWKPGADNPPQEAVPGPWQFFTAEEGAAIEALVDRLIPADPETPGGKDMGCAVYIDRQLAGPYGSFEGLYNEGPFHPGTPQQGPQSSVAPKEHYRAALGALERHCREQFNAPFAQLSDERKDEIIKGLEDGAIKLDGKGGSFFKLLLNDTQQGFLADPIYGGNKDMAAWKMIGFPGARYDYRDWVERHNERYPLPPISIKDHPNWSR